MTVFMLLFFFFGVPVYAENSPLSFHRCPAPSQCSFDGAVYRARLAPGALRAEFSDTRRSDYGAEQTIEFEFRIGAKQKLTCQNGSIVIAQLHAENGQSPILALRYKSDGQVYFTLRHLTEPGADDSIEQGAEIVLFHFPLTRQEWQHVRLRIKTGNDGYVATAINDRDVFNYEGPVGYRGRRDYFKFGVYDYTASSSRPFVVEYRAYISTGAIR